MAGFGERHISHAGHQPVREYPDTLRCRCRCSSSVSLPCGSTHRSEQEEFYQFYQLLSYTDDVD